MDIIYHDQSRIQEVRDFIEQWNNTSKYLEVNSSGSTGEPKTIRLPKELMKRSAQRTLHFFSLKSAMNAGLCLSLTTIAGKMMVVRALLTEMQLHVFSVNQSPLAEVDFPLDFNAMVPIQALNTAENASEIHQEGLLLVGGSSLTENQFKRISGFFHNCYQTYGMTETASHIALRKISTDFQEPYNVLNGYSVSEKDGCLRIHCPDYTDKVISTNDYAEILSDQSFRIIGRKDFVINSGGIKVHPESIENRINTLFQITCLVVPVPDEHWGEIVGLVLTNDAQIPTLETLKDSFLPAELPKKYTIIDSISYTENGKVNRQLMLEKLKNNAWQAIL